MKNLLVKVIAIFGFLAYCNAFSVPSNSGLDLAGQYTCQGYDRQDKWLSQNLTITLNTENSILQNGYGAYTFNAVAPGDLKVEGLPPNIAVTGSMASSGNTFAMSFKNTNPKAASDYGTAVGVASHDQDRNGISHTVLHLFAYQSVYKGGDNSTWTCIKVAADKS